MAVRNQVRASDAADTLANLLWMAVTPAQILTLEAAEADPSWAVAQLTRHADEAQAIADQLREALARMTAPELQNKAA